MCICSSLAWPCSAGAAVESGRILPSRRDADQPTKLPSGSSRDEGDGKEGGNGKGRGRPVRCTSSSRFGRFSNPFFKLSVARLRSSSWAALCRALCRDATRQRGSQSARDALLESLESAATVEARDRLPSPRGRELETVATPAGARRARGKGPGKGNVRSGVGVEQDVSILQVLRVRPGLQVLLERVAALDGRDGGFVDGGCGLCVVGHGLVFLAGSRGMKASGGFVLSAAN